MAAAWPPARHAGRLRRCPPTADPAAGTGQAEAEAGRAARADTAGRRTGESRCNIGRPPVWRVGKYLTVEVRNCKGVDLLVSS